MTLLQLIGVALLLIGFFSLILEVAHVRGGASVSVYAIHMVAGRIVYTAGVVISIIYTDATGVWLIVHIAIMVVAAIFIWFWGFKSLEDYKKLRKSRQDLDEFLDNWGK